MVGVDVAKDPQALLAGRVEVAATGEVMPPKSTYFFPKVPTGLLFNPLA